ncbi:hypothetical protein WICPIJ_000486 [Wickerhamomyces pijperi]|uniref:Uncharacterized protein n=1 Tax=Wickerhamomyces pijperi TaxID=599730 RepID=A0A9P8TSI2_WICPI|nr:hypothetical protein WICPIJ_000486 [Wickerhamomyces pijperi]
MIPFLAPNLFKVFFSMFTYFTFFSLMMCLLSRTLTAKFFAVFLSVAKMTVEYEPNPIFLPNLKSLTDLLMMNSSSSPVIWFVFFWMILAAPLSSQSSASEDTAPSLATGGLTRGSSSAICVDRLVCDKGRNL